MSWRLSTPLAGRGSAGFPAIGANLPARSVDIRRVAVRSAVMGAGFFAAWAAAIFIGRQLGWNPGSGLDYLMVGALGAIACAVTPVAPWLGVLIVGVASAWPAWVFDVPEIAVIPLAMAGFLAARADARIVGLSVLVATFTVATVLPYPPDLTVGFDLYFGTLQYLDPSIRVLSALLVAAALLLGRAAWAQRRVSDDLRHRNDELVSLRAADQARIVSEERTAIAREVHDVVAHHVTAIVIRGQAAIRVSDPTRGASIHAQAKELRDAVDWITTSGQTALAAMREVVKVVRFDAHVSVAAPAPSFVASFDAIIAHVRETGLALDTAFDVGAPLGTMQEFAVLRICQESLTNVLLHSQSDVARIRVSTAGGTLELSIDDDGPPSERIATASSGDRRLSGGQGVRGMRERAEALGGTLSASRSISGGWSVRASLPLGTAHPVTT